MHMTRPFLVATAMVAMSLSACGDEEVSRQEDDARTAAGDVRGGTISDAMLPLDRLESQSPPLREEATPSSGEESSATDGGEVEEVQPSDAATDEAPEPQTEAAE